MWDLRLTAGHRDDLSLPDGYTTALVVLQGAVRVERLRADRRRPRSASSTAPANASPSTAMQDATALLLCGEPIDEPIVGQGPFVMNTEAEIRQAMIDYQSGRMGHLG